MSTYLSLFTGAGGLDLGLDTAGWTCTGQAEIDATCRAVLARHWPDVPRWADVRDVAHPDVDGRRRPVDGSDDLTGRDRDARHARPGGLHAGVDLISGGPVGCEHLESPAGPGVGNGTGGELCPDLIAGGFPCQDVSVAGRRAGLAGDRSGLWWEFHRIIDAVRPRAVLVENVEGLLSSNGGRDLGAIIDALADLGYGVAWRVLDAQHFGVPQRRRRVFLLALTGGRTGAERAAEVLTLTTGSNRDPQASPSPRPGTAGSPAGGTGVPRIVPTLTARYGKGTDSDATDAIIVNALDRQAGGPYDNSAQANHLTPTTAGVRRLTPRECERLMGWPDDHTRWTADGREIADSRRYAMCGNGVVAPVATWIGARLLAELTQPAEVAA